MFIRSSAITIELYILFSIPASTGVTLLAPDYMAIKTIATTHQIINYE